MTPTPGRAAADAALARLDSRIRHCDSAESALQEMAGLVHCDGDALYDPVADRMAVFIPGDLARRLSALAADTAI